MGGWWHGGSPDYGVHSMMPLFNPAPSLPVLPAGQVVFSDGTTFAGNANLTWDATTGLLVKKNISVPIGAANHYNEVYGAGASCDSGSSNITVLGALAVGSASSSENSNVVIGTGSSASGGVGGSIVVGSGSSALADHGVVLGQASGIFQSNGIAIGVSNLSFETGGILIGVHNQVAATHSDNVLLGSYVFSARAAELVFGGQSAFPNAPSFRMQGALDGFGSPFLYDAFRIGTEWIDHTYSSRKTRARFYVEDTAEREFLRADSTGAAAVNVKFGSGGSLITQAAALATTATDGFLYIPTSAGVPTGVPTAQTGTVPIECDITGSQLYFYNGAWIPVGTGAPGPAGRDGLPGMLGEDGIDGADSFLPGPTGPIGPTGPVGITGLLGMDGQDGLDGAESCLPAPA